MAPVDRSAQITLRALVTARWVLLGLLAVSGTAVLLMPAVVAPLLAWFPQSPEPVGFVAVWLTWLLVNVLTDRLVLARGRATRTIAGLHLLVDATMLTVLLGISGGATNPFTTVYFLPITLATQVSPRWTWALAGYCLVGFAALFVMQPLPQGPPGHEAHFAGHLRGMWVAFGVSGLLITTFVHRIALSLARQRKELARLREQTMQDRHLAALGTLAAGAAHELGTPLGSIQLLVGELPHMGQEEREEALATVKRELSRCKGIVHRMASPQLSAQAVAADGGPSWPLRALGEQATRVAEEGGVPLRIRGPSPAGVELRRPREPLEQIVRELVANAVDACRRRGDGAGIVLWLGTEGDDAIVEVRDRGVGMAAEVAANAFNPFYSTKAEGEGMGLGLYLARAQLRQLGGTLELRSLPDRGTTMRITLPLHPDPALSGRISL
ncbi:HAMP domain-containing histidine kinase [Paraliomyxa miuraensis]|uniref:HAMP domain-containing histidine kinase n=1 Tax=Paraliomyxa miuraensis TaxID=376150 RepID=UPI002255E5A0|nr:HAMP domain-containing histidine kinase [Paraliomyxa miuraensis]MCX4245498.1 ATP-binding protein [Paraliomyxa miuraensis]